MPVTFISKPLDKEVSPDAGTPPVSGVKKRGRPSGVKNKNGYTPSSELRRKSKAMSDHAKLGAAAGLISQKLEETATLTETELLEKAASMPEARGKNTGYKDGVSEELAERSAVAYRLMIRGLTTAQIAEQMNVSKLTAASYVKHVEKSLRLDPKILDVGYYMGESMSFFQEIRQMALLHASSSGNSVGQKLMAMRLALEAESSKNSFLQKIGVYSPVVVERIEKWLVTSTLSSFDEAPEAPKKVNLAAELGRLLASTPTVRGE